MEFYDRLGYHDYEGVALSLDEQQRLVDDLGSHHAMILRNHGLLTVGRTPAEACLDSTRSPPRTSRSSASRSTPASATAPGARFGPAHVRAASKLLRPYNPALDVLPFDRLQVADAGDIACTRSPSTRRTRRSNAEPTH
jgi:hypothetical protein